MANDFNDLQFQIKAEDSASPVLNNVIKSLEKIQNLQSGVNSNVINKASAIDPNDIQTQKLIQKITDGRTVSERKLASAELSRYIAERNLDSALNRLGLLHKQEKVSAEQLEIANNNVSNAIDVVTQKKLAEANAIDAVNKERQREIELREESERVSAFSSDNGVVDDVTYLKQQEKAQRSLYQQQLKNIKADEEYNDANYESVLTAKILLQEREKKLVHDIKVREGIIQETQEVKKNNSAWKEKLKHLVSISSVIMLARQLGRAFVSAIEQTGSYVENLNLFAVTFGKTYEETAHWALETAREVGLASNEIIRYTGLFKQLSTAIGVADETGTSMSKTLTQLGYDFASFYNIDTKSAMEKLQAGIFSGQTKPLRSIGIDITYQSIDHLLETNEALAKFNTTSKKLDQSQKAIARTILVMQAGENAFGDMKNTIETLQNQIRVFQASLQNFKLAVGDLIQEPVRKALVYINAFLIAVTDIIRAFKPLETYSNTAGGQISQIGEDAEYSNEEVEKLNNTLASFDKFNVLGGEKKGQGVDSTDDGITEALQSELEKQQELYKERMEALGEFSNKATELAKKIKEFFIVVDNDGKFVSWTPQAIAVFAVFDALSLLLTGGLVSTLAKTGHIISGISISIGLLLVGILSLVSAWDDMSSWEKAIDILLAAAGAIVGVVVGLKALKLTVPGALAVGAALAGGILMLTSMVQHKPEGFANGGITDANFIMTNENGKREWVGKQQNHTAVVNDSQMTDVMRQAVAQGVYDAIYADRQSSSGTTTTEQPIDIYIDGDKIFNATRNVAKRQGLDFARV